MERDVSLVTGRRVTHALERLGHEVHPLDVEESTTERLMELDPEAAFVCLHGLGGEDGTVQALLETLGIPYTGSGPLSSIRSRTTSARSSMPRLIFAGSTKEKFRRMQFLPAPPE